MNEPITAAFRWSQDEYVRAQRLALRYSKQGRSFYLIVPAIGGIALLGAVVNLCRDPADWTGYALLGPLGAFFCSMPLIARRAAIKSYAQWPDRDMDVQCEISEGGIRSGTAMVSSEINWAFFQKGIRTQRGFLLLSGRSFHWLPVHAFRDSGEAQRFSELAKSKVKDYKQKA